MSTITFSSLSHESAASVSLLVVEEAIVCAETASGEWKKLCLYGGLHQQRLPFTLGIHVIQQAPSQVYMVKGLDRSCHYRIDPKKFPEFLTQAEGWGFSLNVPEKKFIKVYQNTCSYVDGIVKVFNSGTESWEKVASIFNRLCLKPMSCSVLSGKGVPLHVLHDERGNFQTNMGFSNRRCTDGWTVPGMFIPEVTNSCETIHVTTKFLMLQAAQLLTAIQDAVFSPTILANDTGRNRLFSSRLGGKGSEFSCRFEALTFAVTFGELKSHCDSLNDQGNPDYQWTICANEAVALEGCASGTAAIHMFIAYHREACRLVCQKLISFRSVEADLHVLWGRGVGLNRDAFDLALFQNAALEGVATRITSSTKTFLFYSSTASILNRLRCTFQLTSEEMLELVYGIIFAPTPELLWNTFSKWEQEEKIPHRHEECLTLTLLRNSSFGDQTKKRAHSIPKNKIVGSVERLLGLYSLLNDGTASLEEVADKAMSHFDTSSLGLFGVSAKNFCDLLVVGVLVGLVQDTSVATWDVVCESSSTGSALKHKYGLSGAGIRRLLSFLHKQNPGYTRMEIKQDLTNMVHANSSLTMFHSFYFPGMEYFYLVDGVVYTSLTGEEQNIHLLEPFKDVKPLRQQHQWWTSTDSITDNNMVLIPGLMPTATQDISGTAVLTRLKWDGSVTTWSPRTHQSQKGKPNRVVNPKVFAMDERRMENEADDYVPPNSLPGYVPIIRETSRREVKDRQQICAHQKRKKFSRRTCHIELDFKVKQVLNDSSFSRKCIDCKAYPATRHEPRWTASFSNDSLGIFLFPSDIRFLVSETDGQKMQDNTFFFFTKKSAEDHMMLTIIFRYGRSLIEKWMGTDREVLITTSPKGCMMKKPWIVLYRDGGVLYMIGAEAVTGVQLAPHHAYPVFEWP